MTARLPVVGSTAATTAFCSARIDGPGGTHLYVDGNGKITRENGTLADPRPNAFSLVQVETCPGSTEACRGACYVHNLQSAQGATHDLYKHNTAEIQRILADDELGSWWVMAFASWVRTHARGGFRWHVSGDVFSPDYAIWIADVCREAHDVPFWIYTRSFGDSYLGPLAEVCTLRGGNLALNLSADRDNVERAMTASLLNGVGGAGGEPLKRLRVCYMALAGDPIPEGLGADDVIFPDYALRPRAAASLADSEWWQSISQFQRGLVCPVDAHGKSEKSRCGPCARCLT